MLDTDAVKSNTFWLEWPRGSGRLREIQEVDRAGWFSIERARAKLLKGQLPFLHRLSELLRGGWLSARCKQPWPKPEAVPWPNPEAVPSRAKGCV